MPNITIRPVARSVTIGGCAHSAMGAVVTPDVPAGTVLAGPPARVIGTQETDLPRRHHSHHHPG